MEMKNICGKIPIELHAKVREEIEQLEISTQDFIQQVIEEHFMKKGVNAMVAKTIAVQVTEELFKRLKAAVIWKGCKQKDFLLNAITRAIEEVEMEQRTGQEAEENNQEIPEEEAGDARKGESEELPEENPEEETEDAEKDESDGHPEE